MSKIIDVEGCKSYKTEKNLMRALSQFGWEFHNPLIVKNEAGRFTAVFSYDMVREHGCYIGIFAIEGFKTIGNEEYEFLRFRLSTEPK